MRLLGVDAGGTKTLCAIADETGRVLGVGRAGSANYQGCGVAGAASQIGRAIQAACDMAGGVPAEFDAACLGVAGADRPADFSTIRAFVDPLLKTPRLRLENDTIVALRAGTEDGVGVALIAGTGSNAIGRARDGTKLQVGGLGRLSGDYGSAYQLAEAAIVAAIQGDDGRGLPTSLTPALCRRLGLSHIHDIIEFFFYDCPREPVDLGQLAPLLFEQAVLGDRVAVEILEEAGENVARAVRVILERLFPDEPAVPVVFGGAVFQKGASPHMIEAVMRETLRHRPATRFVRLADPPVLGAVLFAMDDAGLSRQPERLARLRQEIAHKDPGAG
ncbi:MAG: ATPase [Myxococcales bacterium]|nr:ATPase [Myxococcales bacterium]